MGGDWDEIKSYVWLYSLISYSLIYFEKIILDCVLYNLFLSVSKLINKMIWHIEY